jgi:IS1 family transposase
MTDQLFARTALITGSVGIVAVVYLDRRRPNSNLNELRETVQQIVASTQRLERSLKDRRRVINDAHKKTSDVTKGVEKPAR